MKAEDLSTLYSELTPINRFRLRRMAHHERKYRKLSAKLETIEDLLEELS